MNSIIQLSNFSVQIPVQRKTAVLIAFQTLVILDNIQFEFRRDPGCKFKSDINMRIDSAAEPSGFCKETDCTELPILSVNIRKRFR